MKLACFTSFQPQPVTIDALAYDEALQLVAQGSSDGSINLMDAASLATIARIPSSKSRSVRRLLFYKGYLLSCGVHGSASMWDLATLSEVDSVESSQGAVWDMALEGDKLYLATETGAAVVVDLTPGSMRVSSFLRASSKVGQVRALSVCVESGHVFVGDARGSISRWTKGSCDVTFSIPTKNDLPTLVWRLLPTGNGQIVSGDSLGGVTLWDVKSCTVLQSRHDHQADVLAMAIRGSYLYTSGVDARVNNYKLDSKKLNHLSTTGVLTRDVCAMVITEAGAIVGGADARLGVVQKSAHPKLDRFTQPGMCVVRHDRVFCQNGATQIKVFTQSGEKAEYLANIDNKTDIACFALNDMGDTVLIAGIDGTIRSLTLNTEAKEINATEVTKVEGLVTSLAVNDRYSVVAVAGGSVSLIEKGKSAVTLPTSELKDIVTNIRLFGGNKVLLSTKNTLSVLTIDAITKTTVSGTFKLESGVITSLSEKIEQQVVVTSSDHRVFILSSTDLKEKTQRKLPSKPSKFHHTKWVELDDKTMSLFAESFILTAELNEQSEIVSGFKFNSALPTGGAIVGVGKLESGEPAGKKSKKDDESVSKTVAIMASFKETSKALIVPFERKQFQK